MRLILITSQAPDTLMEPLPYLPLHRLAAGQTARVARILGRPDHVHRLEEFGVRQGSQLEMFRPGNPCIIRLAGNKVCLRVDELLNVLVEPGSAH